MARNIHEEKRLTVRVPNEVWVKLREEETLMADDPTVFISKGDGRKWRPKQAQIAEAVLINYLSLLLRERQAILRRGVERLNALIEEREPAIDEASAQPDPGPDPKAKSTQIIRLPPDGSSGKKRRRT